MAKRDVPSPNENMAPAAANSDDDVTDRPIAKRARLDSNGRIAVAGRVASVKLQNFMCHAHLLIEFDTAANNCFYIGGPNGSGKSALFAAINLGLGGRGSDNDRGNTVKSYIKDGTTQAKITITLTNGGLNSHPDYDDFISVERTINQSASTYIMKSIRISSSGHASERVISKKKGDIDRIISRFNIHLSNPAFWMSQDRSRSFLANFKPSNVYKLYLESTNLEKILLSYQRFADALRDCREIVRGKADEVKNEADQLKRMQEQKELAEKIDADRFLIKVYMWRLLFCQIRDYDDQLQLNTKKMELHNKLHTEIKAAYQLNRTERTAVELKGQKFADEVEALKMEIDDETAVLDEITTEYSKFDLRVKAINQDIRMKNAQIGTASEEIKKAQREVRALMEKEGSEELTSKLKEVEDEHAVVSQEREQMETGDELENLKERLDHVERELKNQEDAKYQMSSNATQNRRQLEKNVDFLRRVKAMKKDTINRYGFQMADILNEINKNKSKFKRLPIGPLGKFIKLKDKKWAYPVEECLKGLANNFLCTDANDAKTLRGIFSALRIRGDECPAIIVSRFLGHAHSGLHEPSAEFPTIYRVLEISDPDVHNAIIDKANAESVLLIEQKLDAMNLLRENGPRNAIRAFTLDGSVVYSGYPIGQYRCYAGKRLAARGLFGSSQEDVDEAKLERNIQSMKDEIHQCEGKERELQTEVGRLKGEQYNCKRSIDTFEKKLSDLRSRELRAERAMKDLKKQVADSANEDNIDNLNFGIEEIQKKIPELKLKITEHLKELEDVKVEMQPILDKKGEQERTIEAARNDVKGIQVQMLELQKQLSSYDEKGDVLKMRLDKLNKDTATFYHLDSQLKSERDEVVASVEQDKKNIEQPANEQDPADLSDFPPTDVAKRKLQELQKSVHRASQGCDQTITLDSIKDFKEQLKKRRFQCRLCDEVIDSLEEVQTARLNVYPILKKYTEMKVCDKFQELLEVRGHFMGGLEFDHEKQTLNVNVQSCKDKDAMLSSQPTGEDGEEEEDGSDDSDYDSDEPRRKKTKKAPKNKKKKKARDLKGLSGGERSFVTAALVMSLWEVMEQPFRMMDEFDVFMDMMNRKLVMDLLVELATKKFPHNQFIFFTPQGIKELKIVDGLQVFEMNKVRD